MSTEDQAKMVLDDLLERLPEIFDMEDIRSGMEEVTPYAMVCVQEVERMNKLLVEIRRSLLELDLGLKGDLTMSEPMENIMFALAEDRVPASWEKIAYPSLRGLGSWLVNLLQRVSQLSDWSADLGLPKVTWLSGLFNPQSFLTAVMQTTARRNDWPLDKTVVLTEVTKKQLDAIEAPARDGAFIHGLTLEGARWDEKTGSLEDSHPKELYSQLPVVLVRLKFAETMKEAVSLIEQGHVRVGPHPVTDPAYLVSRSMEDFVTWVTGSKIKRAVMKYNDKLDDYDLL